LRFRAREPKPILIEALMMNDLVLQSVNGSKEKRLFHRVQVSLEGRYMSLRSCEEFPCVTYEISPGDASIFAAVPPWPGDKVVLYLRDLGRFTGCALRSTEQGFEMSLQLTQKKQDRLADQLTWYANRSLFDLPERRRHDRLVPLMELVELRLISGETHIVRIRNLSLSGVAIETDLVVPFGEDVFIGRKAAKVVRIEENGFACQFHKRFMPGDIDETTRL
jgi:hypothetical protein